MKIDEVFVPDEASKAPVGQLITPSMHDVTRTLQMISSFSKGGELFISPGQSCDWRLMAWIYDKPQHKTVVTSLHVSRATRDGKKLEFEPGTEKMITISKGALGDEVRKVIERKLAVVVYGIKAASESKTYDQLTDIINILKRLYELHIVDLEEIPDEVS